MDVMTIMPPLRRPGHVSIAERGVTEGTRAHYAPDSAPSAFSQGRTGSPGPGGGESQGGGGDPLPRLSLPSPEAQLSACPHLPVPSFLLCVSGHF